MLYAYVNVFTFPLSIVFSRANQKFDRLSFSRLLKSDEFVRIFKLAIKLLRIRLVRACKRIGKSILRERDFCILHGEIVSNFTADTVYLCKIGFIKFIIVR